MRRLEAAIRTDNSILKTRTRATRQRRDSIDGGIEFARFSARCVRVVVDGRSKRSCARQLARENALAP